jgi:hypothetical protein
LRTLLNNILTELWAVLVSKAANDSSAYAANDGSNRAADDCATDRASGRARRRSARLGLCGKRQGEEQECGSRCDCSNFHDAFLLPRQTEWVSSWIDAARSRDGEPASSRNNHRRDGPFPLISAALEVSLSER